MMQPDVIIAAMLSKVHTDTIFEHADVAESPWMAGMTTCAAAQTAPNEYTDLSETAEADEDRIKHNNETC